MCTAFRSVSNRPVIDNFKTTNYENYEADNLYFIDYKLVVFMRYGQGG